MKGIKPITKESLKRKKSMREVMEQQIINSESATFSAFLNSIHLDETGNTRRRGSWSKE